MFGYGVVQKLSCFDRVPERDGQRKTVISVLRVSKKLSCCGVRAMLHVIEYFVKLLKSTRGRSK